MLETELHEQVDSIRRFNRFYTKRIGVLHEGLLESPYSLTEVRILYELAHSEGTSASQLARELDLDPGYLSRMLRSFAEQGLIGKSPSEIDGRQTLLWLTEAGKQVFTGLNRRASRDIEKLLERLAPQERQRLARAMETIEQLLGQPNQVSPYILRTHQAGDMGWVVHRHGALYAREYGWNEEFEALVAELVSQFLKHFDAKSERCWIAEKDGINVGSVFLVRHSNAVAKLRLLLVEEEARGLGIGARLVEECIRFARQAGYERITLWTNSVLTRARKIYESKGFELVKEERHHSFGRDLVGETWELSL